jgi:formate/nitrite transporter FocA (FNT family)
MERLAQLTWAGFFLDNLLPVTLGNMVGWVVLVAAGRTTNDPGQTHHDH